MSSQVPVVVSYGAGTNSTAMLIEMVKHGERADLITFADTGGERPETYAYLTMFSAWLVSKDYPAITTVKKGGRTETLEENCHRMKMLPSVAYGFKSCSQKYLSGQRPADVLLMRKDDIEGSALGVVQNKTHKKLRIMLEVEGKETGLGALVQSILRRNESHSSPYLILTEEGRRVTTTMLRRRWDDARDDAAKAAEADGDMILASRIRQFQFRDIRPKAASEITNVEDASLLLGHTKGDITERVYRRIGALAKPTK